MSVGNQLNFVGRLARTPELKTHGDVSVCHFTLLRDDYAGKDDAGEAKKKTVGIPFVAFGSTSANIAKYCFKGDQLLVTARIENDSWDKEGEKQYGYNFIVDDFEFGAPGEEKRNSFQK